MKRTAVRSMFCVLVVCCGMYVGGCSEDNSRQAVSDRPRSTSISNADAKEEKAKGCGGSCCSSKAEKVALVCKMTDEDLRERKATVIASLRRQVLEKKELDNGYAFKFNDSEETLAQLNEFIKTESQCCEFFTFNLTVDDAGDQAWLSMTGPEGVKEFIAEEFRM